MWYIPSCNLLLIRLNRDMRNSLSSGDLPLFKLLLHLPPISPSLHSIKVSSCTWIVVLSWTPLCSLPVSRAFWKRHTDCRAQGEAFPMITGSEGLPPMSQKWFHFSKFHVMLLILAQLGTPGCLFGPPLSLLPVFVPTCRAFHLSLLNVCQNLFYILTSLRHFWCVLITQINDENIDLVPDEQLHHTYHSTDHHYLQKILWPVFN